jgi:hypothetical protein
LQAGFDISSRLNGIGAGPAETAQPTIIAGESSLVRVFQEFLEHFAPENK